MAINPILPVVLLMVLMIGAAMLILLGGRNKQLEKRIEALTMRPAGALPMVSGRGQSIRITPSGSERLDQFLGWAVRMPFDLPGANALSPRTVFVAAFIVAGGVAFLGNRYTSLPLAVLLCVGSFVLFLRLVFGWEFKRYQRTLQRQLPDAIEMVVSATRAGLPVSDAFRSLSQEMPSPMKDEFIRVMNEIALGVSPQDALHAVYRRTKVPEFSIFAVTIGVQTRSGGRLAETIQNLAATVRTRLGMAARAKALAGEARVSAFILGSMPFVAGGALSLIKPGYLDPLFNDPRGHTMLTIAGVGLVLGILTMRTLIGSATKE